MASDDLDIAALYRRYGPMVRGRCRSLLGNDADAQEVCQEVFLKAHRYRDRWRGEAAPTTWLFKITTTTCLNWLRSRKRRREDLVEELPEPARPTETLLDTLALRQLADLLLDEADEGVAAAVVYFYVDGMTHAEAGELLGVSAAAVRKRIGTFRRRLQSDPPPWMEDP
jgi:RNA polymerase sigma-70 factor (ECF subfamily)